MNSLQHKQDLLEAVRFSPLLQVKSLLQEGGDVNALYPNGKTLLITAVERGELNVIEHLISAGADLNQRDFADRTALMYAADKASVPSAELLLKAGANVNAQNKQGRTALMYAVYKDALDVTQILLDAGAQVNLRDHRNQTALNYSDYKRAYKCQNLLKKHGAEYATVKNVKRNGFREALDNVRSMDEFTELKQSPAWGCNLFIAYFPLMVLLFILQSVCGPFVLLLLLGVSWLLSLTFPSVWKIVPLWREIQALRAGKQPALERAESLRTVSSNASDIEFVSQLMELGSRELSSIHHTHTESRSLPVLDALFTSRLRSIVLALSIFLPAVLLSLPGILRMNVGSFFSFSTPVGIPFVALIVLLPIWIPLNFKLERRLRLQRLRLVQQDRDRIAGEVSTMLTAEDINDKELPADFGLYLRAFMTTDKLHLKGFDLETMLAYSIAPTLPLVALGKPGEHLGAGRIQTTDEHWQEEILRLMQCARLILIIPSHRAGTLWEIATLRDGGFLDKTIFIMPPEMDFHASKFSVDWHKTVLAAREAGVEFPEHIPAGAFFRLSAQGGFLDYSPFVPEEFLREFDPTMGGADMSGYDGGGDASFDAGSADGIDGAVDSSSLGADGIDSGGDGGGSGGDGGGGGGDGGGG